MTNSLSLTARLSRRDARRGIMLLIVTLVIATLTLSGAALLLLMKTEREATETRGLDSLVKGVDRSAVVFLIGAIEASQEERERFGGLYDNPNYFCAAPLLTIDEGGEDSSRFTVVSPELTDTKIEGIRYGLVDESTRLNLEAALAWENETPGAGRNALLKLPGMTPTAADSILDWIDPDETARSNGAEAAYYSNKKLPYSPRNAVPVFLEEILLARGVTRSQLYGSDENFTYNADKIQSEEEQSLGGSLSSIGGLAPRNDASSESVPWKELLTVFSAEKDVDPSGEARVDLNGDNLQFLYQELQSRVGDDLAKFVVLYRQYGPQTTEAASSAPGARGGARGNAQGARRTSGYAQGAARGNARGAAQNNVAADGTELTQGSLSSAQLDYETAATTTLKTPLDVVGARVVVGNVVYDSPIRDSTNAQNIETLFKFLDFCSTSASTTIVGRVNINAAPRVVLSAIPGLTTSDVQTIIDRRPDPTRALPKDFRHASWLYAKGVVNLETMRRLYDKTTARGDVYRGQIIGFLDGSDETARAEVVVDGTTIPPRQVFYKDLTTLGKGFSPAVLLGGLTSGSSNQNYNANDYNATRLSTDLFEIEQPRTSGYTSRNGADEPPADPFAAIDAANSAIPNAQTPRNSMPGATPFGGVDVGWDDYGGSGYSASAFDAVDAASNAATVATNSGRRNSAYESNVDLGESSGGGSGVVASSEPDQSGSSRRQELLNTLREGWERRLTRYNEMREDLGMETYATADDADDVEEPEPLFPQANPQPISPAAQSRQNDGSDQNAGGARQGGGGRRGG
ncbi:MAG: general secretion pathway protein GspK [Thermoguttaceae bacterium]|nr:general secretion pathway protein GspK [Thermoguttaceae bacterium]